MSLVLYDAVRQKYPLCDVVLEIEELETLYANLSPSGVFDPPPFINLDVDSYSDWFWSNTDTGAADYFYFDFELGIRNVRSNSYQALYTLPVRTSGSGCL